MAANKAYTRGKSGYSKKDEEDSKRYGELIRIQAQDLADRKASGEKGIITEDGKDFALGRRRRAEANYKENLSSSEGREVNRKNMKFNQDEINKLKDVNGHKWKGQMK